MPAFLLDVATPGPALSTGLGGLSQVSTVGSTALMYSARVPWTVANTYYALASVTLGPGTWAIIGEASTDFNVATITINLSLVSGSSTSSWTVLLSGGSGNGNAAPALISAVIKLTATTTIYLNGSSTSSGSSNYGYGNIFAVQTA